MREEDYMIGRWNEAYHSSSTSSGYWMKPGVLTRGEGNAGPSPVVEREPDINFEEVAKELKRIADEEEEDKRKHLPIFNPEDLDV